MLGKMLSTHAISDGEKVQDVNHDCTVGQKGAIISQGKVATLSASGGMESSMTTITHLLPESDVRVLKIGQRLPRILAKVE